MTVFGLIMGALMVIFGHTAGRAGCHYKNNFFSPNLSRTIDQKGLHLNLMPRNMEMPNFGENL